MDPSSSSFHAGEWLRDTPKPPRRPFATQGLDAREDLAKTTPCQGLSASNTEISRVMRARATVSTSAPFGGHRDDGRISPRQAEPFAQRVRETEIMALDRGDADRSS